MGNVITWIEPKKKTKATTSSILVATMWNVKTAAGVGWSTHDMLHIGRLINGEQEIIEICIM